jgi:soluble cytochrome b562
MNHDSRDYKEATQEFITILDEHRKNCERLGKYAEAEVAKLRLNDLKNSEDNRRKVIINKTETKI